MTKADGSPVRSEWRWYVEPHNAHTKDAIVAVVHEDAEGRKDTQGTVRDVWECSPKQVHGFSRNARRKGLSYTIYVSYNGRPMSVCKEVRNAIPEKPWGV